MTKKRNLWIVGILAVIIGYCVGDVVGIPNVRSDMLSGDVGRAELYHGQKTDPDVAAVVERLQSDTAFCNLTSKSLLILKERVDGAQALAERTSSMCSDVPEMQNMLDKVQALQAKAYNAALALDKVNAEIAKISKGEKSELYEQASSNAFICFIKTENQVSIGKDVFSTINSYLKDKNGPEADEMAQLAADWSKYCIQDAVFNGSKSDIEFWNKNLADANSLITKCVADMEKQLGMKLIGEKFESQEAVLKILECNKDMLATLSISDKAMPNADNGALGFQIKTIGKDVFSALSPGGVPSVFNTLCPMGNFKKDEYNKDPMPNENSDNGNLIISAPIDTPAK